MEKMKTFEELAEKILIHGDLLSTYLRGHLMIEFLQVKIMSIKSDKYSKSIGNISYFKLTNTMYDLQYINEDEKKIFIEINKIRNKFAHDIEFYPSVAEMRKLFESAQSTFLEFFEGFNRGLEGLDKVIELDLYGIEIFIDFFMEIIYNLKCLYDFIFEDYYKI